MASIWEGAVELYRNLSRLFAHSCPNKVSVKSLHHASYSLTQATKEQFDPAYRAFVFYKTMSPNEVSRAYFKYRNIVHGGSVGSEAGHSALIRKQSVSSFGRPSVENIRE
jgi:hypothetical protein